MDQERERPNSPFWSSSGYSPMSPSSASASTSTTAGTTRVKPWTVVLFLVFSILLLLFLSSFKSMAFRPTMVKSGWESLNIAFLLFAVICGFLGRNKVEDAGVGSGSGNESGKVVQSPPYTPRLKRCSSSYPDLKEPQQWRFSDDLGVYGRERKWDVAGVDRSEEEIKSMVVDRGDGGDRNLRDSDFKNVHVDVVRSKSPTVRRRTDVRKVGKTEGRSNVESPPEKKKVGSPPPPPPLPWATTPGRRTDEGGKVEISQEKKKKKKNVDSPPPPMPPSPPPAAAGEMLKGRKEKRSRKRRSGGTKDIATAIAAYYQKKRKRNGNGGSKGKRSYDDFLLTSAPYPPPPPPLPPPPSSSTQKSALYHFFRNKKEMINTKSKWIYSNNQPPPSPPPPPPATTTSSAAHLPLPSRNPMKKNSHEIPNGSSEIVTVLRPPPPQPSQTNGSSQIFTVLPRTNGPSEIFTVLRPPPPPPPPQRNGSSEVATVAQPTVPEVEEVKEEGVGNVESALFCPSPDVNNKADIFIARLRAGWRLEKLKSIKEKEKENQR